MEEISNLVTMISSAVTGIAIPLLGVLLFYDAKKRKQYAEARKAEADNLTGYADEWKRCYEEEREVEKELNTKIDELYKEKEVDRQRIRELQEKNTQLALENMSLKIKECQVRGCAQRRPPSDY